jgi:uncharacterized cupin superfamily protein
MPHIYNATSTQFKTRKSPVPEFSWHTSEGLSEIAKSKYLDFEIRSLDPDRFSYPYHFHRDAEEPFVILSGEVTLRTPEGFQQLNAGDIVFFESGPNGAHQLYNHSNIACQYLDIRTKTGIDICEYPDSGKINILPYKEVFDSAGKADYYRGEDSVRKKWPKEIMRRQR